MANSKGNEELVLVLSLLSLLLGLEEGRRRVLEELAAAATVLVKEDRFLFVLVIFLLISGSTTSDDSDSDDLEAAVTVLVRGRPVLVPGMDFFLLLVEVVFGEEEEEDEEEEEPDVAFGGLPRRFRGLSRLLSKLSVGAYLSGHGRSRDDDEARSRQAGWVMPCCTEEALENASDRQTPEDSNRAAKRMALVVQVLEWIMIGMTSLVCVCGNGLSFIKLPVPCAQNSDALR